MTGRSAHDQHGQKLVPGNPLYARGESIFGVAAYALAPANATRLWEVTLELLSVEQ
jgi:hypothetical protein